METSLWQTTQEGEDTAEWKAYTSRQFADKMMHRLRGMKRIIEVRARVPQWILQQMESIEATVRCGLNCDFFPVELVRQLSALKTTLNNSDRKGLEEWAKEVENWMEEWQVSHDEWEKMN
jgi:hypothetical protein